MEQALRCRTLVKAQNIMGSQCSRKQRRWRKNIQGSCKADFHSQFGNIHAPLLSGSPSHLDGIPPPISSIFGVSIPIWGGILSPVDTVMSIKSQKGQSWRPWLYPAPPSLQILLDPVNLCPLSSPITRCCPSS